MTNDKPVTEVSASLRAIVMELADGAKLRRDDDSWILVKDLPQPSGPDLADLFHRGWLVSMPNGGTCKLSDAGLQAYVRSTDELGDGKLLHPHEWRN